MSKDTIIPAVFTASEARPEFETGNAESRQPVNRWYFVIGIIVVVAAIIGFVLVRKQSRATIH